MKQLEKLKEEIEREQRKYSVPLLGNAGQGGLVRSRELNNNLQTTFTDESQAAVNTLQ